MRRLSLHEPAVSGGARLRPSHPNQDLDQARRQPRPTRFMADEQVRRERVALHEPVVPGGARLRPSHPDQDLDQARQQPRPTGFNVTAPGLGAKGARHKLAQALVAMASGALLAWTLSAAPAGPADPASAETRYETHIRPWFETYCGDCHGERKRAGLDLRPYADAASVVAHREVFESVLQHVETGLMPPQNKPQPTLTEREQIVTWLRGTLFRVDCTKPDPGRVTLRRLNRTEYNFTMRDLAGVDVRPADDFPMDDIGYGFDNIGDVLSLPPVLLEKYLAAAGKVLDAAIVTGGGPLTASHRRIFFVQPATTTPEAQLACAREIIREFARRAYRRPVAPEEVERLLKLYAMGQADGEGFAGSVKLALHAVLVSPHFLFREELQPEPGNPDAIHPVSEFALASRLSYFLWSTMPDEELFHLAERGALRARLGAQVRRMLADPRASAVTAHFAGQWLQFRTLDIVAPDRREYPGFDEELRRAMQRETELFFETILREDRSVLEFVDADWTFVNERLARHYGIPDVTGTEFRRVNLAGTSRGGVLTHGSFLTLTSNPTRTSPVKRGKWVLDNLLNTPPPPPPPDVPLLEETPQAKLTGTLRQRMEQHRADPLCASCHALMDPIGFGFENFDGIGAWRNKDGDHPIDPAGQLASGETFQGPAELKRILLTARREEFLRCLASKLLTYALGRGLEYYDQCAVDGIVENLRRNNDRFSALVLGVVNSPPFQLRRGEGRGALAQAGDY